MSTIETKLLLNSIIYDAQQGYRLMRCDHEHFLLATPILQPEYMKLHIHYFPQDMIETYNLMNKVSDGYVDIKTKR